MNVSIIFDEAFSGGAEGVVWVIDTPHNRRWFEAQRDRHPASATFSVGRYPTKDDAVIHMIWNAQEHTPAWATISVIGASLTDRLAVAMVDEGHASTTDTGFRVDRL